MIIFCWLVNIKKRLINPHPHMRGPCVPLKTLPGAPAAFFGTPEPTVYLIVHNTEPLSQTTLFFPSGTVMALKPWHNAISALGSVRTPQSISCDSIILEWWLEFPNPQTLWSLWNSVHENICWWISIDKTIPIMPICIMPIFHWKWWYFG